MDYPKNSNRVKDRVCIKELVNSYDEVIPVGTLIEVVTYGPFGEWNFKPVLKNHRQPCGEIICNKEMVYKTHKKHFKAILG